MSYGFRHLENRTLHRVALNSAAGQITLATAVRESAISVVSMVLSVSGAGDLIFLADAREIGRINFSAAGREVFDLNPDGWIETDRFEDLRLQNPSAVTIKGWLVYITV